MATKKQPAMWMNHPILDASHSHDLDQRAAIHEFQNGKTREDAERLAHEEYRMESHLKAAAHHLVGMKMAHAAGSNETAQQHYKMYESHMKRAGKDPNGPVPPEVEHHKPSAFKSFGFLNHGADSYLPASEGTTEQQRDKDSERKESATR